MNLKKDDWIGLGASVGLHLVLLLMFAFMTASEPQARQLGYMEVELGPFAEGQPVQEAEEDGPDRPDPDPESEADAESEETVDPAEEPAPPQTSPDDTRPVELPEAQEDVLDDDVIETSDAETINPEEPEQQDDEVQTEPEAQAATEATAGGAEEGDSGEQAGDDGDGDELERSAPFDIEGLNRDLLSHQVPEYREQVNATIQVRITVDPQGRIVGTVPIRKGDPALEQAVMDALERWRFNPLPPGAPQENQQGVVTFQFRLQ